MPGDWLRNDWLVILAIILGSILMVASAQQTSAAPTNAEVCQPIAVAGNIVVYRCEPDDGWPFLVNSVGFMALEE